MKISLREIFAISFLVLLPWISKAHTQHNFVNPKDTSTELVLADLDILRALHIFPEASDPVVNVGLARLSRAQQQQVLDYNHSKLRCGGFEKLTSREKSSGTVLSDLRKLYERDARSARTLSPRSVVKKEVIEKAMQDLRSDNLKTWVEWLSSFPTRSQKGEAPNDHVFKLREKLEFMISGFPYASIRLIEHRATRQNTIAVTLVGSEHPDEIVVLGGHLDSISGVWGGSKLAPGADDNASGSSNLIETLRVLLSQGQPRKTVEFFWYAAEEAGLVGSNEVAKDYKAANKNVTAVIQLDMTLHPGSGIGTLATITDFTTPALRQLLEELNTTYVGARIVEDKCGYACSDHASWYRQGYPTVLPFESSNSDRNRKIHSPDDVINSKSSFEHTLVFSKLALAFAMELAF